MFKTKTYIILFTLLLIIATAFSIYFYNTDIKKNIVVIKSDNEIAKKINLSTVTSPYTFTIENNDGINTIYVSKGEIYVKEASCPDKVCVNHGPLKNNFSPIVCLPNKLIIEFYNDNNDIDTVSR